MTCKELALEIRSNKVKYSVYASLGGVILFLLSSVVYLLIVVSQLNSIIYTTTRIQLNNTDNPYNFNNDLLIKSGLTTGDKTKSIIPDMRSELHYNLTRTNIILSQHIEDIKSEFVKNNSKNRYEINELKHNISKMLTELTLLSNMNKQHLERAVYINLTKMQNMIYVNRTLDKNKMNEAVDQINKFIVKNVTNLNRYITYTKKGLVNNISRVLLITKGDILKHKQEINKQLNYAFVGKHMYWETCPDGWNETGGVYPVKVCIYK